MTLPEAFLQDIKPYLSPVELESFVHALTGTEASTCIRLNRSKLDYLHCSDAELISSSSALSSLTPIPWNPNDGFYLDQRPSFTLDPLLHAGAYYVQEGASQFVTHVLRSLLPAGEPVTMLDLCAAPGGKSTAALSALPAGSILVSNEIDRRRSRILSENVTKWGQPNVIVTGNAPADFSSLTHLFDVVLTDVPCSGEGMFRKDEGAVNDWSPSKVEGCVSLQRQILRDIWQALKPGGLLIYSTCTFNVHEDEEQLKFICEELGAEPVIVPVSPDWQIHESLVGTLPCYRFMPHQTKGEGLFMAALRKFDDEECLTTYHSHSVSKSVKKGKKDSSHAKGDKSLSMKEVKSITQQLSTWVEADGVVEMSSEGLFQFIPSALESLHRIISSQGLFILQSGIQLGELKGRDIIPAHALAMSIARNHEAFATVEIPLETALQYLRREAIVLPSDSPAGYVIVCYQGFPLGFVKNMGNRSNNLYPTEWRIRNA